MYWVTAFHAIDEIFVRKKEKKICNGLYMTDHYNDRFATFFTFSFKSVIYIYIYIYFEVLIYFIDVIKKITIRRNNK